jgi:hypothetical protein
MLTKAFGELCHSDPGFANDPAVPVIHEKATAIFSKVNLPVQKRYFKDACLMRLL